MSICSVNGHIFCKLVLVAEAMSLVADLAMPVEINVVSWGRLHAMCYPLTCDSIFLGVIYVMLWPAAPPRYAYQHGQYSLMVVILPVWTPWSDSALCSVYLPAARRVGDVYVKHHGEGCWVSSCFSFLLSCLHQCSQKQGEDLSPAVSSCECRAGSCWRQMALAL